MSLKAENGIKFNPQSIEIKFPGRNGSLTVEVTKPGIQAVTYTIEGDSRADFETPGRGIIFAAPKISYQNTKPSELERELPVGCLEHESKETFSCKLRLLSTTPWEGSPVSTNGVVHLATSINQTIPLSLIGLNLNEPNVPRDNIIDTVIAKTSTSNTFLFRYQRNGKCNSLDADASNLLELIENDAFVSAFMQSLSAMTPDWLTLAVSKNNKYFDIQNIVVTIASNMEHCSGFPLHGASSLAYYRPAVSYNIGVDQTEVALVADGRTCFAINVCNPSLFINFPKEQAELLKSSLHMYRDMTECCEIDLSVDSVGFLKDTETSSYGKGRIWNGLKLQEIPLFSYNAWLKGRLDWKMEIPNLFFVTLKITGEVFIKSRQIDFVSILT